MKKIQLFGLVVFSLMGWSSCTSEELQDFNSDDLQQFDDYVYYQKNGNTVMSIGTAASPTLGGRLDGVAVTSDSAYLKIEAECEQANSLYAFDFERIEFRLPYTIRNQKGTILLDSTNFTYTCYDDDLLANAPFSLDKNQPAYATIVAFDTICGTVELNFVFSGTIAQQNITITNGKLKASFCNK